MGTTFDNSNLYERVYVYLRDKILNNELQPGSKIVYEHFLAELGVSRTPLRDAINRLKQDGLIEVKARSGSYVYFPNAKDIEELYDVRKALECQALLTAATTLTKSRLEALLREADEAETAIKKGDIQPFFEADRNLHRTIIEHSNNRLLISIMSTLELKIKWFGVIITKNFDRPLQANDMHKRILRALYESDHEKANALMSDHIEEIKRYTMGDYA
ncbi:GntR family transcriptional regulator [Paenibacillus piri]|uniref:GntR family transcriptional regulator n=1 Tax=Paenibacillus piri TaxID=2547395 RepID=A0A4R5KD17_9BACL|nr:GntR family transcriptional regulator [Paenibacillus piri]TDF93171.1 GntR family transcriptional regulator [Paenibacillus piri]